MPALNLLRLSFLQIGQLRDLLVEAFLPTNFDDLMITRLGRPVFRYAAAADDYPTQVRKVLMAANTELWWREVLREARNARPADPGLLAFGEDVGQGPVLADAQALPLRKTDRELELRIQASQSTFDILTWRRRLGEIESRVCRIEMPEGRPRATGFLIGPDLVMTNYHVIQSLVLPSSEDVTKLRLRFDYKVLEDGISVGAGKTYGLAANWLEDYSPFSPRDLETAPDTDPKIDELDYALLRVDGRPGDDPVGGDTQSAFPVKRGWISLPAAAHDFAQRPALYIVQHPDGKPMQIAIDSQAVIAVNTNRTRVRYTTTTEPGSSGSPCFNANWEWVALHHSGDPKWIQGRKPEYNEGVPIPAIVTLLKQREKGALLIAPN